MSVLDQFRAFLVDFHERHPGGTAVSLRGMRDDKGRTSYKALAEAALDRQSSAPRVLELGCGDGTFLAEVLDMKPGASVSGIDITPGDIELARKLVPSATLCVADFTTCKIDANAYDVIASHLVLMLSGPLEPVLGQVRRALVPGGTFAFVVDDINAGLTKYAELIDLSMRAAGVESPTVPFRTVIDRRLYDKGALSELFASFGLEVERFEPHTLRGEQSFEDLWEMLSLMYQIGSMSQENLERARAAVKADIGEATCSVVLPFELVTARRTQ